MRSFKKQVKKFWKEYGEGKKPDWLPIHTAPDGRQSTDPNCLIRTPRAQRVLRDMDNLFKKIRG